MAGTIHESKRHYVKFAPKGDQPTLINILNRKLVGSSAGHSDEWREYLDLPRLYQIDCSVTQ